ncbi:hypothetical protein ACSBR1_012826 [Camellia fascicularis]
MMRKKISMPTHLIHDGHDPNLFKHYSSVAMRIGVYTAMDYIDILEHLVHTWNIDKLIGLSGDRRDPRRLERLERDEGDQESGGTTGTRSHVRQIGDEQIATRREMKEIDDEELVIQWLSM